MFVEREIIHNERDMIYEYGDFVKLKKTKQKGTIDLINGRWVRVKLIDGSILKTTTFEIIKLEKL